MLQASKTRPELPRLGTLRMPRATLSATSAILLLALYFALSQNHAFLTAVWHSLPQPHSVQEWRIAGSASVAMYGLMILAVLPFSARRVFKPAAMAMLVIAAVCSYFMDSFGTVINRSMITNVLLTDTREASDLLRPSFFLHVALQGLVPALLLAHCEIRYKGLLRESVNRLLILVIVMACITALMATQYSDLAFWGRENRRVRLYLNPIMPVSAFAGVMRENLFSGPPEAPTPIATDAVRIPQPNARPLLVVLVVGETARAANFQLNGYSRMTNPKLAQTAGLINFPNVSACGTATAESVPCMFSMLQRSGFSRKKAAKQENLLDVLRRVGVEVSWRDNDSGCQEVCRRVDYRSLEESSDSDLCDDNGCHDGILLRALEESPPATGAARLLVLHQKGSHGPAYFKRYPESSRHFKPDCRDENVQRCSREETVNAYDNTIVYTDEMLASLIETLERSQSRMDSVLIYVSDHGESLGENGLYLHGLPYAIAPGEQTHVPMIAWFSSQAPTALGLDLGCVQAKRNAAYSHDNLFSSILGILDIKTKSYEKADDIFSTCRRADIASA